MTRFVLVPGAWLGAWVWKRVVPPLEKDGHAVYPVTLTGMGERVHLASKEVGMETAIPGRTECDQIQRHRRFCARGAQFRG